MSATPERYTADYVRNHDGVSLSGKAGRSACHDWVFPMAAALGAGTFFGIVKLIVWVVS